jgi:hypothetical protein
LLTHSCLFALSFHLRFAKGLLFPSSGFLSAFRRIGTQCLCPCFLSPSVLITLVFLSPAVSAWIVRQRGAEIAMLVLSLSHLAWPQGFKPDFSNRHHLHLACRSTCASWPGASLKLDLAAEVESRLFECFGHCSQTGCAV